MAAKKKPKHGKKPRQHHHHGAVAKKTAKPRRSSHPRRHNPEVPAGMALVPVSALGGRVENPAHKKPRKKHGHKHPHHVPRKHNPAPEGAHAHLKQAGGAVGFGLAAAVVGIASGWALSKVGMKSKAANVVTNLAVGTAVGGLVGLADRAAGTIVAHNYYVAAGQWAMADVPDGGAVRSAAPQALKRAGAPVHQLPARNAVAMHGADDDVGESEPVEGYERLEGVIADNFADPDELGDAEIDGFEKLEGYERLEGVIADNFADPDELGDPDEFGDAEWDS